MVGLLCVHGQQKGSPCFWEIVMGHELNLGKFIFEKRTERNVTREELAYRVGVGTDRFSRLERGIGAPPIAMMVAVCDALNVSVDEFYGYCGGGWRYTCSQAIHRVLSNAVSAR